MLMYILSSWVAPPDGRRTCAVTHCRSSRSSRLPPPPNTITAFTSHGGYTRRRGSPLDAGDPTEGYSTDERLAGGIARGWQLVGARPLLVLVISYGPQTIRSSIPLFIVTVVGVGPVTSKWIFPFASAPCGMVPPVTLSGLATNQSTR